MTSINLSVLITHLYQVGFIPRCMDVSKLVNHISGLRKKNHANISTEKISDKIQHPFLIKTIM